MSLPAYTMGQVNLLDWSPVLQAQENALGRAMKQKQLDREYQLQQQRLGMDQTRLGFEENRLGFEREAAQRAQQLFPEQIAQIRAGIGQTTAQTEGLRQDQRFKGQVQPYQLYGEYQQQQLRDKQLEAQKIGRVKSDEDIYVQDPFAPGGVRFIDRPNAGAPGAKKFAEEAAKQAADRYAAIVKHGDTQPSIMFDLLRMQELSDVIGNPNAYNSFVQKYGGWMKSVGINPSVAPNLEQFSALISKMAPNLRPPGSGATSDFDLQQYINSLPQFMQTAEGRKAIIAHQRAVAAYAVQQKSIAQQVLLGNLTRAQGEERLNALPDPHAIWKEMTGRAETAPGSPGAPTNKPTQVPTITNPADAKKLQRGQRFIYNGTEYEVQ